MRPRDPTPAELGRRIKMFRVARGLTLKDVETRGGTSATHVSEIERGRASPTVGALGRIASALGLEPAVLVAPHVLPEISVMRGDERRARRLRLGAATIEPAAGLVHGSQLGAYFVTLPVGPEPAINHRHEGEQWVLALAGTVGIQVDGDTHILREGDCLHYPSHREHSFTNMGSTPATLLVATRPRITL